MRRLMIVEDEPALARLFSEVLPLAGDVEVTVTTEDFASLLAPEPWEGIDAAVVDLMLGEAVTGRDILVYLKEHFPDIRRVVLSAVTKVTENNGTLAHVWLEKAARIEDILKAVGYVERRDGGDRRAG